MLGIELGEIDGVLVGGVLGIELGGIGESVGLSEGSRDGSEEGVSEGMMEIEGYPVGEAVTPGHAVGGKLDRSHICS